jgi:hypothetical protein
MAITLNGTTGITTPDVNSDGLTVDTTTLVVDEANNRVGIGTSSPTNGKLVITGSSVTTAQGIRLTGDTADARFICESATLGAGILGTFSNHSQLFYTNATERARIDSSGSLLVGTTSAPSGSTGGAGFIPFSNNRSRLHLATTGTTANSLALFYNPNGLVGNISTSGSATIYATSSDYRLKENVVGVTGASERVQQLNPVRFNFIADPDKTVDGFLAHEVQDVVPEAITGTKDAVDADGNPDYQGIDQSKLVPLLTAALQEALGKIETLEARVAALEASNV